MEYFINKNLLIHKEKNLKISGMDSTREKYLKRNRNQIEDQIKYQDLRDGVGDVDGQRFESSTHFQCDCPGMER